jgi:hypothetical protein
MTTLTVTLVSGTDDDLAANEQAFRTSYLAFVAEREIEDTNIGDAVHAVFDQYRSASINMPALAGFALTRLNVQPENFKALETRVMEYVRENADRHEKTDKETGLITQAAETPRTRSFVIAKGKGGGVKRWSDHPVKA